jgi:hypothetical protein
MTKGVNRRKARKRRAGSRAPQPIVISSADTGTVGSHIQGFSEIWRSVVAICTVQGDPAVPIRHHGTGFLFRVGDRSFLVTASHVYRDATKNDLELAFTVPPDRVVRVPRSTIHWINVGEPGSETPHDVALAELDHIRIAGCDGARFLTLSDALPRRVDPPLFGVFGYPEIWSGYQESQYVVKGLEQPLRLLVEPAARFEGYEEQLHLLFDGNPESYVDEEGNPAQLRYRCGLPGQFPRDLTGMSGSPVLLVGSESRSGLQQLSEPVLVGVQTCVYSDGTVKAIRATRIEHVARLLRDQFPDLRPSFQLYRGA